MWFLANSWLLVSDLCRNPLHTHSPSTGASVFDFIARPYCNMQAHCYSVSYQTFVRLLVTLVDCAKTAERRPIIILILPRQSSV